MRIYKCDICGAVVDDVMEVETSLKILGGLHEAENMGSDNSVQHYCGACWSRIESHVAVLKIEAKYATHNV